MSAHRDQLLHGLFTTALEGGIGYWSECSDYWWGNSLEDEDLSGFYADIVETGDGDVEIAHKITRTTISKGYALATSADWRNRLGWSSHKPPIVPTEDDDWDYDASDADMIVQLGLFGDVVYG